MIMKTNLIFDLSNLAFIIHHSVLKKNNGDFSKEYLLFRIIQTIKYIALEYKADGIIVACDSPNVWRREFFPEYKAHRDKLRDPYYDDVKEVIIDLAKFFNEYTLIPALSVSQAEADDIIAVICQTSIHKNVIVSSDKDFIQLIDHKTKLYSPTLKKERETEDKEFELFEKCIRGDRGDNIPSAFPNVRKVRLKKAWDDDKNNNSYEMVNLMETIKDDVKVKDAFERNKKLIDLTQQPELVKNKIITSINNIAVKKYNNLKLLRFIGEHDLKGVSDEFLMHKYIFKKSYIPN